MASTFDEIDDTLTAVARAVRRASAEQLGPHGIAMHQVRALRTIERLGGRPRIADLAERMRIAPRSATARTASAARAGPPSVTAGSWTRCAAATDAERLRPPRAVIRRRDGGLMRRVRSAPSGTACRCPP